MVRREESCSRTLLRERLFIDLRPAISGHRVLEPLAECILALLKLIDLLLQVVADRSVRASARRSTMGGAGRRRRPKRETPFPDRVGRGDPEAVSVR